MLQNHIVFKFPSVLIVVDKHQALGNLFNNDIHEECSSFERLAKIRLDIAKHSMVLIVEVKQYLGFLYFCGDNRDFIN